MKRLFIALDLSIAVVEQMVVFQEEFARELPEGVGVRWTAPENIHLTMKFLGNTDEALVPMLVETLGELAGPLFPFEVEARGVGAFPEPSKPRIIWAGLDDESAEVLGLLQKALEKDVAELGFEPEERDFKPHITLGRIKSRARPDLGPLLDELAPQTFGKSYIKDLILYESRLSHAGPTYTVVDRFPLGA